MSEIKPVYQLKNTNNGWNNVSEEEFEWQKIHYPNDCRIVYSIVAYEALQKENENLAHRLNNAQDSAIKALEENAEQSKRIAELEENNGLLQTQVHCLEIVAESKNGDKP